MIYYTGVGSRETPKETMKLMTSLAQLCRKSGFTLRSGGAGGADTAFEVGAGNLKEIYLPWKGFNGNKSLLFNPSFEATEIARKIHPSWKKLTSGAQKLHSRNVHQVLGKNLDTPSSFLIAWTEGAKEVGGTRTALVLAKQNNIPIFNLGHPPDYDLAERFINDLSKEK